MELLDRWAQLNIEMDYRAKKHMPLAKHAPRHYHISAEPWSMWVSGKKILSVWTNTLYDLVHSDEVKEYWCKKLCTTDGGNRHSELGSSSFGHDRAQKVSMGICIETHKRYVWSG